jgi:hypothetical protein
MKNKVNAVKKEKCYICGKKRHSILVSSPTRTINYYFCTECWDDIRRVIAKYANAFRKVRE